METTDINKAVPIVLPASQWAAVKEHGRLTGRSASAIARAAIDEYLKRERRKPAPPQSNPTP